MLTTYNGSVNADVLAYPWGNTPLRHDDTYLAHLRSQVLFAPQQPITHPPPGASLTFTPPKGPLFKFLRFQRDGLKRSRCLAS